MTGEQYAAWVMRVFGSWEAHAKSLPARLWVRGLNGWHSSPR